MTNWRALSRAMCVVLIAAAATARAEVGHWEVGVQPGYSIFDGYQRHKANNAFSIQAFADYQATESLSTGLELGTSSHKVEGYLTSSEINLDPNVQRADYTSNTSLQITQITPEIKFGPWFDFGGSDSRKFRWYTKMGAGPYIRHQSAGVLTFTGGFQNGSTLQGTQLEIPAATSTFFGMNGGLGISVETFPDVILSVDGRYHDVFAPSHDILYVVISGAIAYSF
jgi:hypothetical protein